MLAALLLAGCGSRPDEAGNAATPPAPTATTTATGQLLTFAGQGRDRLCLDRRGGRAGFITYGTDDRNCSVTGALQEEGDRLTIVPDGDAQCRIAANLTGSDVRLGPVGPGCAYYCATGVSFAGRTLRQAPNQTAADLAGDPLC